MSQLETKIRRREVRKVGGEEDKREEEEKRRRKQGRGSKDGKREGRGGGKGVQGRRFEGESACN